MADGSGRILNVRRNILYDLLQFVVSLVLPFAVRTVLIYRFGVEYLGLSSLFASILGVLSLMELGFGTAVTFSLYKPAADGDIDLMCAYLTHYRRIYRIVGLAILVAGLVVMPFLESFVRDASPPGGLDLRVCYLIYLADAVVSYWLYGYMAVVPTAFQRKDVLSRIDIVMALLACVARVFALVLGSSFYPYLLVAPAITVVRNLVIAREVRRRYPGIECMGDLGLEKRRDLRRRVYGVLVKRLSDVSRNGIDSLCISAFVGLSMTGRYSNYYYVMSGVLTLGIMVCRSMVPSVGNSVATESVEKNYADMRVFDFVFMAFVGWATACMACLYQPFMRLWVGEGGTLGLPIVAGFCAYYYILEAGAIQWAYHQGAGLWWECRFAMVGEAVANVTLNVLLCGLWGVGGVVAATVLSVSVTNFVLFPRVLFVNYFRNGKLREYWADHGAYAAVAAVCALTSWAVCEGLLPAVGFACLFARLALCTALCVGVNWLVWHRSERFAAAIALAKRVVTAR